MKKATTALLLTFALAGTACDNDPVGDAPQVSAQAPVEKKSQAAQPAAEVVYELNSDNSDFNFVGAKITAKHPGSFEKLDGKITVVDGSVEKSSVEVNIDMASLSIEPKKLDGHLRSGDFFDIEKFPKAHFESTTIDKSEDGTYLVTGNLTLRGTKKSISFPAKISLGDDSVSVSAKFGINRKDFGIVYPGMPDDLIKDEVLIDLRLDPKKS